MALKSVQQVCIVIKSNGILDEHKSIVYSAGVQSNIVLLKKVLVESRETEGSGVPLWEEGGGGRFNNIDQTSSLHNMCRN